MEVKNALKKICCELTAAAGVISLLALIPLGISGYAKDERYKEELREQFSIVADENKDGHTSHGEWASVYRGFEKHYDVHSNPHKDFEYREMREYIDNHS